MRRVRFSVLVGSAVATLGLAVASARSGDLVLFNVTPSMPTGAYLRASEAAAIGSIVTVRAIDVAPSYATQRSFTNAGDRFLKRVAAGYGDIVCAQNETVTINGKRVALRRSHDDAGRELPSWSGCYTLSRDFVFLLGETPDSFDGRYWGPTPVSQIEGVWRRLGA